MERKDLEKHIRTLATLRPTEAPVISCYLCLDTGLADARRMLAERPALLRRTLPPEARTLVDEAMAKINQFLFNEPFHDILGAALFSRAGTEPFFLPLRFNTPLPNWMSAAPVPNIFHLVELKQAYERYVVVLVTQKEARIMEIALGAVTKELWLEHPGLDDHAGRQWTKDRYERHRQEQTRRSIREKIAVVEELMSKGAHTYLILAGDPRMTAQVKKELPRHLEDRLVDIVHASSGDKAKDIVATTLSSFVTHREGESRTLMGQLQQAIYGHGLGVSGTLDTLLALRNKQVDVLLLAKDYTPGPGWVCRTCEYVELQSEPMSFCPECGASAMQQVDVKSEMARRVERDEATMEVVDQNEFLMSCGGVGALLRYLTPEQHKLKNR